MAHCRVLGAIEFIAADDRPIALMSQAQRRIVAVLGLHANSMVPAVALEELLVLSPGALRTSISRLRRVVGAEYLVTGATGYEFRTSVDAADFERRVNDAFTRSDASARSSLELALALWRGQPYQEFAHEPWAVGEVLRLSELWAAAVEELAVLMLGSGEQVAAVVALEPLITAEPYRDRPRALLIRALAEAGRRTEALRAFQAYRGVLLDDIGIEPSSDLVLLDQAIAASIDLERLQRDGNMAWGRQRHHTLPALPPARDIPTPISSFVGRRGEVAEILGLLEDHRLVTLTGTGGCGKTRLALRAAHAIRDRRLAGVWWVDLSVIGDDDSVAEHVANTLRLVDVRSPLDEVTRRLGADGPTLIVLDNAEHVLGGAGRFVTELLERCPDVQALVTSRVSLGVPGEVLWRVPPLGLPTSAVESPEELEHFDASLLFVTRSRQARAGLVIDRQAVRSVVSICAALDGLPLALELAAARLRASTLQDVAHSVTETLGWELAARPALDRHATLRASIAWSFDLIDPQDQRVLTQLAVFQSSFTAHAAAWVTSLDPQQTSAALARLVDFNLIQLDDVSGEYRLLQTIKQFCLERSQGWADIRHALDAHAIYFGRWCAQLGAGAHGIERRKFILRMPELVAASAHAREHLPEEAMRMCSGLAPLRSALGHHADFEATWQWLLRRSLDDEHGHECAAAIAGLMATATGFKFDTAGIAPMIAERLGPDQHRARGWLDRGRAMVPAYEGHPDAIVAYVEGVIDRQDDLEGSIYVGFAAYMLSMMGRVDRSERLLEELRRITRRHRTIFSVDSAGNGYAAAIINDATQGRLGAAAARANRPLPADPAFSMTAAAALAQVAVLMDNGETLESAAMWAQQGTVPLLRYLPDMIDCCAAIMSGAVEDAADRAEDFCERVAPVPVARCHSWPMINGALLAAGRDRAAERATNEAAELVDAMDDAPLALSGIHLARAQIAIHRGEFDDVQPHASALLDLAVDHKFQLLMIDSLELISIVLERRGDADTAKRVRRATDAERVSIGYRFEMVANPKSPARRVVTTSDETALSIDRAVQLARRAMTGTTSPPITATER